MLRHPWSVALLGRPLLGPNVLARIEHLQAALQRAGLDEPHLSAATHALANYVIGSASTQSTWRQLDNPDAQQAARDHLTAHRDVYLARGGNRSPANAAWTHTECEIFERKSRIAAAQPAGSSCSASTIGPTPPKSSHDSILPRTRTIVCSTREWVTVS
jgi:hypothetical protein